MSTAAAEPLVGKSVRALAELEPAQAHMRRRFGLAERDEAAVARLAGMFRPPAWVSGQVSIHDAMFLYDLVRGVRPRRIIEIGTASGVSAAVLLRGMADAGLSLRHERGEPAVRTFDVHPYCWFDRTREVGAAAREMVPELVGGLRVHARGTAADAGRLLAGRGVELAFIDADHRHPCPVADLILLLPALARGAWVALHDIVLPEIGDMEEARTGRKFEGRYWGARHLFDGWPWEKIAGGGGEAGRFGARNIGAIRLPGDREVRPEDLMAIVSKSWETTPEPRALAALRGTGARVPRPDLRCVGLIAAHGVSGVSSATVRLTEIEPPHQRWRVMAVGPGAEREGLPGEGTAGFSRAAWAEGTPPVDQVRLVRDALREARADVVNPNFLLPGFVAAALDRHRGRRIAAIWHGSEWAAEDLYERAAPLADSWRAVNGGIAGRVERLLGAQPGGGKTPALRVLGAAIRVPEFATPLPCAARGGEPLRILYAAWLDERSKRVMDLAALADALTRCGVDFRLTIAGRGPAARKLASAMAAHIVAGRVALAGAVPMERMTALHREHDVLVLVSANEGSPVTVMEAMAQGRAVAITQGCGGAVEAVRDGVEGFVVAVGAMEELAEKLAGAWREPARLKRMGIAAHAAARAKFDLAALAERYDELAEEAARAAEGPAGHAEIGALWSRVLAVLEMIGSNRTTELCGLCAEWLEDLGARDVWLHWTADAQLLLGAVTRFAPGLIDGVVEAEGGARRLGWPVIGPREAKPGMLVLSSDPGAMVQAELAGATILPLVEPRGPVLAARRLFLAVEGLRGRGCERIALYGAGKHTRRLGPWIAQVPEIVGIVDDRAGGEGVGSRLWGLPIVTPARVGETGAEGVIVSSDEFERVMLVRACEWAGGRPVMGMYEGMEGY